MAWSSASAASSQWKSSYSLLPGTDEAGGAPAPASAGCMAIELAQSAAEPFLFWEKNDGLFIYFYYYFLGFETVKWPVGGGTW
jgi:hypothetical protein